MKRRAKSSETVKRKMPKPLAAYPSCQARAVTVRDDIRRERQMDGIKKAQERGVRFGRKPRLVPEKIEQIRELRAAGTTVPEIIRQTGFSKASVYRALG
jgi:hypothetical protein